jgi:hypothetical protein
LILSLIDTPPHIVEQTLNSLVASNYVVVMSVFINVNNIIIVIINVFININIIVCISIIALILPTRMLAESTELSRLGRWMSSAQLLTVAACRDTDAPSSTFRPFPLAMHPGAEKQTGDWGRCE